MSGGRIIIAALRTGDDLPAGKTCGSSEPIGGAQRSTLRSVDPTSSRTDEQLVRAINRGDVDAFAELYRRHRDWVVSLAWRFTDDRELALDVMQEVFAHLLTRFPGFRLTAKMRTYLYPVVRSVAATHLRRRRGHAGESALLTLPSRASGGPPETIEVLHLIGAHDAFVARAFERQAWSLGLRGGLIGLGLAALTVVVLRQLWGGLDAALLPRLSLSPMN
ncbi:MAG: sigma-70 family RNA polymerase sigma factor, partial [Planctomycetes bacterium]|nr:sigma-70 family RNA polymerase sigma factor [Planctomycetota bacterium]